MTVEVFKRLTDERLERCLSVLTRKAKEYATGDRLHNFKIAAALEGRTPIQALSGMMAKHTVSIYDMCESGEDYPVALWEEKITDSINYLLLLNGLVQEKEEESELVFCERCGKKVDYEAQAQLKAGETVDGNAFVYEGLTAYCEECGKELYVPDINDFNVGRAIQAVVKMKEGK